MNTDELIGLGILTGLGLLAVSAIPAKGKKEEPVTVPQSTYMTDCNNLDID